jgi:hypothetical protein
MSASASFQISVNGGAYGTAGAAVDAPPGATIACRLVSTVGANTIAWSNFGTHAPTQPQLVPVLSGSPTGQIATFTLPATPTSTSGQAYGIECKVNGGAGVTLDNATTCHCGVYCLAPNGQRLVFMSEYLERSTTHGVVEAWNAALYGAPQKFTVTGIGAGGVTYSIPLADNSAERWILSITGLCTASTGADLGLVWCCTISMCAKRQVGIATIAVVPTTSISYWRDAGAWSALAATVTPNAGTGAIDIALPGVAGDTMVFGGSITRTRTPL